MYLYNCSIHSHSFSSAILLYLYCRVSNDRRPGRLVDHEGVVDFEILVGRLLNDGQQGGPAGFGTGNGTLTEKNYDLLS